MSNFTPLGQFVASKIWSSRSGFAALQHREKRMGRLELTAMGLILAMFFLFASPRSALATTSSYQVTKVTRTDALLGDTDMGNNGDDVRTSINFPFPVKIYNQSFDTGEVSSNGVLGFPGVSYSYNNSSLPSADFLTAIFPHWDDLTTAGTGDGIFTNLSGTAPNRTFAIRWKTVLLDSTDSHQDFEIRLHEGSSSFEILYAQADGGGSGATVGVQRDSYDSTVASINSEVLTSTTQYNFTLRSFSLVVDDISVTEGNSGTLNASFLVSLPYASSSTVSVKYATADGTATVGVDYTALPLSTLTFSPGQTNRVVYVPIKGDLLDELDEAFTLNLSSAVGAPISDTSGTGTIVDNDTSTINVTANNVTEGNSGTVPMTFTLKLSVPNSRAVRVLAKTSNAATDPASVPTDYASVASSYVTFAAGETTKTVTVNVNGDTLDENNENIGFTLSSPTNAVIGTVGQGTILDDDATPTLAVNDISVTETNTGNAYSSFNVSLSAASGRSVTVQYVTADGTATAGVDYVAVPPGTLTFTPGQTSKTVNVTVKSDVIDELDETFSLKLSAATNATIADPTGICKIVDNDTSTINVTGGSVNEGNTGSTLLNFVVKLSTPCDRVVTVQAQTSNAGTYPASAPADYTAMAATTIQFAIGETNKTFAVSVNGDKLDEENETVGFTLTKPVNAVVGTAGTGTIIDDDASPSLSITDATVVEGSAGSKIVSLIVSLSAVSGRTVTVQYATLDGLATAGTDYFAIPVTALTFAPGQTSKTIGITLNSDTVGEMEEYFYMNLSGNVNASFAKDTGVIDIIDDDNRAPVASNYFGSWGSVFIGSTYTITVDASELGSDPEFDPLTVTTVSNVTDDINAVEVTAEIINNQIVFTIRPFSASGIATVSFDFTISDGTTSVSGSGSGQVSIFDSGGPFSVKANMTTKSSSTAAVSRGKVSASPTPVTKAPTAPSANSF